LATSDQKSTLLAPDVSRTVASAGKNRMRRPELTPYMGLHPRTMMIGNKPASRVVPK
jgi:hypothetical protein